MLGIGVAPSMKLPYPLTLGLASIILPPEAQLQLSDLRRDGGRIGDIALEHLDCDRTTIGGAQQADHQLRAVTAAVAAVAVEGERTAASFEVSGGDVI